MAELRPVGGTGERRSQHPDLGTRIPNPRDPCFAFHEVLEGRAAGRYDCAIRTERFCQEARLEISGEHRFAAPREVVWELLLDPQVLRAAIPGCEEFTQTAPDSYDLTLKVGIATIKGTYRGKVDVRDRQPTDSYRLVVEGSGKPGKVQGDAVLHLREEGSETVVTYGGDVKAQGALARLGSRLLGGAAKLMAGQFFKAMEQQVKERVVR